MVCGNHLGTIEGISGFISTSFGWPYEPYGGAPVFWINQSFLDDWFCGYKWSIMKINFEHQSMTLR